MNMGVPELEGLEATSVAVSQRCGFYQCAGKNIHVWEWGCEQVDPVVIWHGITGTCHDHRKLARALAHRFRVICPDSVGCGLSEWPGKDRDETSLAFQQHIVEDLLAQLNVKRVRWIGASRGGAVGLSVAANSSKVSVSHLVLNDIGPALPKKLRSLLEQSVGAVSEFRDLAEYLSFLKKRYQSELAHLTDAEWKEIAMRWARRCDGGGIVPHYSPGLVSQVTGPEIDFDRWGDFEKLQIPVLLLRGKNSRIVDDISVERMQNAIPFCQVVNREGGHLDLMDRADEIQAIASFLSS